MKRVRCFASEIDRLVDAETSVSIHCRTGDPATGDFSDATVIRKFGDVPEDLSAL